MPRKPSAKKAHPKPKSKGGHKRKTALPRAPLHKILKDAGAEKVSKKALDELEHQIEEAAKEAVKLARHAKRKTIMRSDIPSIDGVQ